MPQHQVSIPDNEMNQFDLPRICVVTGSGQDVAFKPVRFQWYPPWIAVFVLCSPIIFALVALIMMRRVKGELPFTEAAFAAWQRGKLFTTLAVVAGIALFIAGIAMLGAELAAAGGLALVVSILGPIAVGVATLKGRGPRVVRIDKGVTVLKLPSEHAAGLIASHLTAGVRSAPPAGGPGPAITVR